MGQLCLEPAVNSSNNMKSVIAVMMFAGVAVAAPGGYTGYGGVYKNMNQGADYMNHAKSAAKMAINLFEDESLNFDEEVRPARKAVYVPTFFTSVPQQPQASNQGARFAGTPTPTMARHTISQSSIMSTGPRPSTSPTRNQNNPTSDPAQQDYLFINLFIYLFINLFHQIEFSFS